MLIHPLFGLLVSLLLSATILQECFQKGKILKFRLIASFLNIFLIVLAWAYYDRLILVDEADIWGRLYLYYLVTIFVLTGLNIIYLLGFMNQKARNYEQFVDALKNTQWNVYYLTDKKERILAVSDGLLIEMGLPRERAIGKKAFDVFDNSIRFHKVNNTEITNAELRDFYQSFKNKVKRDEELKKELYFINYKGDQVILNVIEKAVYINNKFKGRLTIGQKKSDLNLLSVEKDLIERNKELESIKNKFISSLELTSEGIFFNNIDDQFIWANDILVAELRLTSNSISNQDFRSNIHAEDLLVYSQALEALTPAKPSYTIRYRFKIDTSYIMVKETGKKIFNDPKNLTIVGYISTVKGNYFERTEYAELDSIKGRDELAVHLGKLFDSKRVFELVAVRLSNLPDINEKYGRLIGNLIMAEYVKLIKCNFLTESGAIFRTDGLVFYFTITDSRKIEIFNRGLAENSLNIKMEYGSIKAMLEVNCGVTLAATDGSSPEEIIGNTKKALQASLNPHYVNNYAFYRDIKDILR